MGLEDHQSGNAIINPFLYIGFEHPGSTCYAINTETFRRCQNWLILPDTWLEDTTSDRFREEADSEGVVPVFAVIGDYNKGKNSYPYGINRSVSVRKNIIIKQRLGEIPLSVLRKEIPKVYESIRADIQRRNDRKVTNGAPF